jgi:NAD(P)-dependent dehydrogenase (short-subunit alcohol dehydrogenase family)
MDFTEKNVLISGGTRGIGLATAKAFAAAGAKVCLNYRQDTESARQAMRTLPGSDHLAIRADLTDPSAAEQLVEAMASHFGRIDVLVNNAGIYLPHPVRSSTFGEWQEAWQRTMAVNLIAAGNLCFLVARQMIRQGSGGHMVNVSSRGAFRGEPGYTAYGASKAGLNAMSQSLAQELAPHGIYVKVVAPGFVETDMTKAILEGPMGDDIRAQSPLHRVATAEEVASLILFLASGESAFLTGAVVDINGASYLRT